MGSVVNVKKRNVFGGKAFEEENVKISNAIQKYCKPYKKILAIDLHTGLGKKGKLQLLNAPKIPNLVKQQVNELFEYRVVDDNNENFFKEHGSFLDFVWNINNGKVCLPVMFEFGTVNSENLIGALRTLRTMITENQAYQNGCETKKDKDYIDKTFKEMFYPKEIAWRNEVLKQFHETISIVLPKLRT